MVNRLQTSRYKLVFGHLPSPFECSFQNKSHIHRHIHTRHTHTRHRRTDKDIIDCGHYFHDFKKLGEHKRKIIDTHSAITNYVACLLLLN